MCAWPAVAKVCIGQCRELQAHVPLKERWRTERELRSTSELPSVASIELVPFSSVAVLPGSSPGGRLSIGVQSCPTLFCPGASFRAGPALSLQERFGRDANWQGGLKRPTHVPSKSEGRKAICKDGYIYLPQPVNDPRSRTPSLHANERLPGARNVDGDRAWASNKYENASVSTGSLSRCSQSCSKYAYCALVGQQLALLFVRQRLCGVILQIGRKMLRGAHPQNGDGDPLDAE
jgi:hypothetical protein